VIAELSSLQEGRAARKCEIRLRFCFRSPRKVGFTLNGSRQTDLHWQIRYPLFGFRFGIMKKSSTLWTGNMRSISKKIAFLCLLLTFWSAVAFAAHHHSNSTDAAKCTVCIAAHSASPKANSTPRPARFVVVSSFRAEPVSAKQRFVAFALSVRPPPSV
jgi:hypothetical protein